MQLILVAINRQALSSIQTTWIYNPPDNKTMLNPPYLELTINQLKKNQGDKPSLNIFNFPGEITSHCSLVVSGLVAITVTTSLEEVSF